MKEGYISVEGGSVWYRVCGEDEKGIPLLLLHGGPGATHDYMEPLSELSGERPVIFYDQLGSGNSDRPRDTGLWNLKRFIRELEQVREALCLDKLHIIGVSWGTMLAVSYVLEKGQDGIASMVLSGPVLSASRFTKDTRKYILELSENDQRIIRKSEAEGKFDSPEYDKAVENLYKICVCRLDPWPECLKTTFKKVGKQVYNHMWGPSEFTVTGTLSGFDVTERLPEIKVPVLFTCGRYDEASPEATKYYSSLIKSSEAVIFEEASHTHYLERIEDYINVVGGFLRRVENKTGPLKADEHVKII
ncbi:MAG: proline iminopeptidase-family hydrolase [Candidatus Omnitrophica bacterium]|nr:proline iminopeptidase-family hydrolase [Candidatus Omnitrophota bacterium]MDD5429324.1 proline iminopeptidase-family hydrolase [Candidatus Omnitrophota bacterium]